MQEYILSRFRNIRSYIFGTFVGFFLLTTLLYLNPFNNLILERLKDKIYIVIHGNGYYELEKGFELYKDKKYDLAMDSFNKVLKIQSNLISQDSILLSASYNGKAIVNFLQGNYSKSTANFKKAIEINSLNIEVKNDPTLFLNTLVKMVSSLTWSDDYGKLKPLFMRIESMIDNYDIKSSLIEEYFSYKGTFLIERKEYRKSIEAYKKALVHTKNESNKLKFLYKEIAIGYFKLHELHEAIKYYNKSLLEITNKSFPDEHMINIGKGMVLNEYFNGIETKDNPSKIDDITKIILVGVEFLSEFTKGKPVFVKSILIYKKQFMDSSLMIKELQYFKNNNENTNKIITELNKYSGDDMASFSINMFINAYIGEKDFLKQQEIMMSWILVINDFFQDY